MQEATRNNIGACQQAIEAFRKDSDKEIFDFKKMLDPQNKIGFDDQTSNFDAKSFKAQNYKKGKLKDSVAKEVMDALRAKYITSIAKAIYPSNDEKEGDVQGFLVHKLHNNFDLSGDPALWTIQPPSWKKLFDKILAGKGMKAPNQKEQSRVAKREADRQKRADFPVILASIVSEWERLERGLVDLFGSHNQKIANIDFKQLSNEIGEPVNFYLFSRALREWAGKHQRNLQTLFSIEDFEKDFIRWQNHLVDELQKKPAPAVKNQWLLLCQEIASFSEAIRKTRNDQMQQETAFHNLTKDEFTRRDLPPGVVSKDVKDTLLKPEFLGAVLKYGKAVAALQAAPPASPAAPAAVAPAVVPAPVPQAAPAAAVAPQPAVVLPAMPAQLHVDPVDAQVPAPVNPVVQQREIKEQPAQEPKKQSGFMAFLKQCGTVLYKIVSFPIWLFKSLFGIA